MRSLRLIACVAIPAQFAFGQQVPAVHGSSLTVDEAMGRLRAAIQTAFDSEDRLIALFMKEGFLVK